MKKGFIMKKVIDTVRMPEKIPVLVAITITVD